mmetsp:Transcript_26568/g.53381  ORF Transcript_26568/g.53381 Transcript_26568/m.53381 type:complete len:130 (-) Transcript_26568:1525-1914(-)
MSYAKKAGTLPLVTCLAGKLTKAEGLGLKSPQPPPLILRNNRVCHRCRISIIFTLLPSKMTLLLMLRGAIFPFAKRLVRSRPVANVTATATTFTAPFIFSTFVKTLGGLRNDVDQVGSLSRIGIKTRHH